MYTPSRSRTRRGGGFQATSKAPLKGLFADGTWHCNCEPRLIAVHLQTKNGGKNHGRWFYTCQKGQPKRCNFFLWDDDAKIREKAAVLNNSRSEPAAKDRTPKKQIEADRTPPASSPPSSSRVWRSSPESQLHDTPSKSSIDRRRQDSLGTTIIGDDDDDDDQYDSFDLLLSNEAELIAATESVVREMSMPPPETPRKAQKTSTFSTPSSKRRFSEMQDEDSPASKTDGRIPSSSDGVFTTPKDIMYPRLQLPSPIQTPTPNRFKDAAYTHDLQRESESVPSNDSRGSLTNEVLTLLSTFNITLSASVQSSLLDLLNRHELRTQGIVKGREIARVALKAKDLKIAELQGRISGFEAERETSRSVISHLKDDIRESSVIRRTGRGSGSWRGRR